MDIAWIPIIISVWVGIKTFVEIYKTTAMYNNDKFVDGDVLHTNQHLSGLYGIAAYSASIPLMIIFGGFVFSIEWIPLHFFIDIILLYMVEHFAHERQGAIKPIRLRDLFYFRSHEKVIIK